MSSDGLVFHDEVELEDFEWDEDLEAFTYPCPCGDQFLITYDELECGEEVATCPSCSLIVKVIYDMDELPPMPTHQASKDTQPSALKSEA